MKFHNGKEMTADDVVASMKRWGEFGARGKLLMENATSVEATGKYEVTLKLSEPNGAWKNSARPTRRRPGDLSGRNRQRCRRQADRAEELCRHRPLQVRRMASEPTTSNSCASTATTRATSRRRLCRRARGELRCDPVHSGAGRRDARQRRSGRRLRLRRVHLGRPLRFAQGQPIRPCLTQRCAALRPVLHEFGEGILKDNFALRRAIQTALKKDEALRVSFRTQGSLERQGSIYPKGSPWYSRRAPRPTARAIQPRRRSSPRTLAIPARRSGLLVSTNYQAHFDQATVFTKQLAEAGINVQMIVVDWATLLKMRGQPNSGTSS